MSNKYRSILYMGQYWVQYWVDEYIYGDQVVGESIAICFDKKEADKIVNALNRINVIDNEKKVIRPKPCPFCGAEPEFFKSVWEIYHAEECFFEGVHFVVNVPVWNQRIGQPIQKGHNR